jgi:hypothetical protein
MKLRKTGQAWPDEICWVILSCCPAAIYPGLLLLLLLLLLDAICVKAARHFITARTVNDGAFDPISSFADSVSTLQPTKRCDLLAIRP